MPTTLLNTPHTDMRKGQDLAVLHPENPKLQKEKTISTIYNPHMTLYNSATALSIRIDTWQGQGEPRYTRDRPAIQVLYKTCHTDPTHTP